MNNPLSFRGRIGPVTYLLLAAAVFFSQHLVAAAVFLGTRQPVDRWVEFWLTPLRSLTQITHLATPLLVLGFAVSLGAALALAVVSFRRALTGGHAPIAAALAIVPVLQIGAVLWLAFAPSPKPEPPEPPSPDAPVEHAWVPATQGMLAGMALCVLAVAISTLVFGAYGVGLFIASPFLIGLTTGYIANRRTVLSMGRTTKVVAAAALLGGAALLIFALEGAICILLAAPLGFSVAAGGGLLGREFAVAGRRRGRPALMSAAALPLIFACDVLLPPSVEIRTAQAVEIAAPPPAVWRALVSTAPIQTRPSWPLRLGIAYPLRSEVHGEGVGAERLGIFSTGVAHERVTAWRPGQRLAFTVLDDPPMMREMSPYAHVHAPHVRGYFHTGETSFELQALAGGRTRLLETTAHELRLDPALYWLPMARMVIDQNNARVLANIRRTAEREAARKVVTVARRPPLRQSRTPVSRRLDARSRRA